MTKVIAKTKVAKAVSQLAQNNSLNVENLTIRSDSGTTISAPKRTAVVLLEELIEEKNAWFNNSYLTSNELLYSLLAKCYGLYFQFKDASDNGKKLREGFDGYVKDKGYVFSSGSHTLTKIVKCVFGSDRRRVSAYSIVLRTALAKQLQVADIPNFIRESGGVEEVRLMKSPNAMTAKQKAEVGAVTLTNKTIINVTAPAFKEALDAGNIGKPVVLIGTWNADGSISVHSFSNSAGAVNAALVVQFAQAKLKTEAQKVETTAANDSQIAKDAVTQAVSEATAMPIAA